MEISFSMCYDEHVRARGLFYSVAIKIYFLFYE